MKASIHSRQSTGRLAGVQRVAGLWTIRRQAQGVIWLGRLATARWLWVSFLAFGLSRLGVALVAYVAAPLIADSAIPPYHLRPDHILLDVFGSRWDTGFYLSIADEGYRYEGVDLPSVAFFPLLPLLIRAVGSFTGDPLVAGLIVANLALLGATMLLYLLVEGEWGDAVADRAVWYLLIFPTAFFGSAVYTESLFLLLAIASLYLARKGLWESAAMLGALAALTRFVGIIVAPVLLVEWWVQRRRHVARARPPLWALLAPAAVLLGTGAYMAYLWQAFGDPLAFAHAQSAWGRVPRLQIAAFADQLRIPAGGWALALLAGELPLDSWIDLGMTLLFLSLGIVLLVERQWTEGVFVVLGALVPLGSGLLLGQRRYMWVLFPAFILLARWGRYRWFDRTITTLFLLGLGLFTALFANWYWVA